MTDKPDADRNGRDAGRQARLRAALRENLKRRKSQFRGRTDQTSDGGIADERRREDDE